MEEEAGEGAGLIRLGDPPDEYSEEVQDEMHPEAGAGELEERKEQEQELKIQQEQENGQEQEQGPLEQEQEKEQGNDQEPNGDFRPEDGEVDEEGFHGFPQSPEVEVRLAADCPTRDLVLAAITVMKGRKARPDTRRLCNWVHRKYGRAVQAVVLEIDGLCEAGVLEKVEYKGSISFRIVSERKLHKRAGRRKSSQAAGEARVPAVAPGGGARKLPAAATPEKVGGDGRGVGDPLTLNLIVTEQLRPGPGSVLSKRDICQAVDSSPRPINKKAVLRDLETILAQEIHLGYLVKVSEDDFCLPDLEDTKSYRGTIAPKLQVSKRKPKPTQKILDMEAELLTKARQERLEEAKRTSKTEDQLKDDLIKEKLISNKLFKMKSKMGKIAKMRMKKEKSYGATADVISEEVLVANDVKLDMSDFECQERKEDLIAKKIKKKKEAWQVSDNKAEGKNTISKDVSKGELRKKTVVTNLMSNGNHVKQEKTSLKSNGIVSNASKLKAKNIQVNAKKTKQKNGLLMHGKDVKSKLLDKRKKVTKAVEFAENEEEGGEESQPPLSRAMSGRKKRARKIFDPADHDLPARAIKKSRASTGEEEVQEEKEPKEEKECNEEKESKEKQKRGVKESKDVKESKEVNDAKEVKVMKVPKEVKEVKKEFKKEIKKEVKKEEKKEDKKEEKKAEKKEEKKVEKKVEKKEEKKERTVLEEKVGKSLDEPVIVARACRQGSRRKVKTLVQQHTDQEPCLYCDGGHRRNERLISCKDCQTTVHPSCLNYPEDLTDQIYSQPWQCINCKVCSGCQRAGLDDQLLFCDSCDQGHHMACHLPAVTAKPIGRWECSSCASHTGFQPAAPAGPPPPLPPEEEMAACLPALPPGLGTSQWQKQGLSLLHCPPPATLPYHWQDSPVDLTLPDCSGWSPARVSQYLVQHGIPEIYAKVFFDEEIDGPGLLVLQRHDVLKGLGIKLGPALKIYNRIRALQTRRHLEV